MPPKTAGARARTRNVLDRFAIDYALCMYCGICVEVCPFDALFWSPHFEYSTDDLSTLTHEMDTLAKWMDYVPPPPALEEGAEDPIEVAKEAVSSGSRGRSRCGRSCRGRTGGDRTGGDRGGCGAGR
jgi:NADH-quinone oxidoreductase subunit I